MTPETHEKLEALFVKIRAASSPDEVIGELREAIRLRAEDREVAVATRAPTSKKAATQSILAGLLGDLDD